MGAGLARHCDAVISDLDIQRVAKQYRDRFGDEAVLKAAQQANRFIFLGEAEGGQVWKRIAAAVQQMEERMPELETKITADTAQTRLAIAALAACLVRSLGESNPGLQSRFEALLEKAYHNLQGASVAHTGAMETLTWTRQFLKEI